MTAITFANLGASATPDFNSSTDATSYASASWTPPTSGVIALCVANRIANPGNVPTVTGNGITWTQVATLSVDPGAAHRMTWFLADAAGATTGATTVDFAGQTQLSCAGSFLHITANLDVSGGSAAAVVQAPNTNGSGTTGTIDFATGAHADNRAVCGWFHAANEATTPDGAWVEVDDFAGTGPTRSFETQWNNTGIADNTSSWGSSSAYIGLGLELKASVGLIGTVNQNTETDVSQPIGRSKAKAVGQNSETDLAQVLTRLKQNLLGQNIEADTAQAFTVTKQVAVNQVTETETAQAITSRNIRLLNQVAETDSAQAIASAHQYLVSIVTETDAAQAVTLKKVRLVIQAEETDIAQSVSIGGSGELIVNVAQVTETDAAQSITAQRVRAIAQASETDSAQGITSVKYYPLSQVSETDLAQSLLSQKVVAVSQVTETDLAQALFPSKRVAVAQVVETDLSQPITVAKQLQIGQLSETDIAQSITWTPKYRFVAQVTETDLAQSIGAVLEALAAINFDAEVFLDRAFGASVIRDRTFASSSHIDRAFNQEVELIDE